MNPIERLRRFPRLDENYPMILSPEELRHRSILPGLIAFIVILLVILGAIIWLAELIR